MRAKILNLRYDPSLGGFDDRDLQAALARRETLGFQARFFEIDEVPRLSCLLVWRDGEDDRDGEGDRNAERDSSEPGSAAPPDTPRPRRAAKPAVALELDANERRVFEALRAWRRARAAELGLPAFRVLTDRQLAAVTRARPLDTPALAALAGVGEARALRCGEALFSALRKSDEG